MNDACTVRLQYYLQARGFSSLCPFKLRFDCVKNGNTRQSRYSFEIEQLLGARSERHTFEMRSPRVHYEEAETLVLAGAVQMCGRAPGGMGVHLMRVARA